MGWLFYAFVSAGAAALTAILAKIGIEGVPSTLATAIRTVVITLFAWAMVGGLGEQRALTAVSRRSLVFLVFSGLATGVSWLAYFRALQLAPASRVAPIDKLSLAVTVLLAVPVLGAPLTFRVGLGGALIIAGAVLALRCERGGGPPA